MSSSSCAVVAANIVVTRETALMFTNKHSLALLPVKPAILLWPVSMYPAASSGLQTRSLLCVYTFGAPQVALLPEVGTAEKTWKRLTSLQSTNDYPPKFLYMQCTALGRQGAKPLQVRVLHHNKAFRLLSYMMLANEIAPFSSQR